MPGHLSDMGWLRPALAMCVGVLTLAMGAVAQAPAKEPDRPQPIAQLVPLWSECAQRLRERKPEELLAATARLRALATELKDPVALAWSDNFRALAFTVAGQIGPSRDAWRETAAAWARVAYVPGQIDALARAALLPSPDRLSLPDELTDEAVAAGEADDLRPLTSSEFLETAGRVAEGQGRNPLALRFFGASVRIRERLAPESPAFGRALVCLGRAALAGEDVAVARAQLPRAYEQLRRVAPGSPTLAEAAHELGRLRRLDGEPLETRRLLLEALAIREPLLKATPDAEALLYAVASSNHLLGIAETDRGDFVAALHYCELARETLASRFPGTIVLAQVRNSLGIIHQSQGGLERAAVEFGQALSIAERVAPDSTLVAAIQVNLGNVALERGDVASGEQFYRKADRLYERLAPESLDRASTLSQRALVASRRRDNVGAERLLREAVAICERRFPAAIQKAISLANLGAVLAREGRLGDATGCLEQAINLLQRASTGRAAIGAGNPTFPVVRAIGELGSVKLRQGEEAAAKGDRKAASQWFLQARTLHQQELEVCSRVAPNTLVAADSLARLGLAEFKLGRLDLARQLFQRAAGIYEDERRRIHTIEARADLLSNRESPYPGLLAVDVARGDGAGAFATLERARARSLLELMSERGVDPLQDAPEELRRQQAELDRQRSVAYAELLRLERVPEPAQGAGQPEAALETERRRIREELAGLAARQRTLDGALRLHSPRLQSIVHPRPMAVADLGRTLDPGTLALSYFVDDRETFLLAIEAGPATTSRRKPPAGPVLRVYRLPISATTLAARVRDYRLALSRRASMVSSGTALSDALLKPVLPALRRATRLLVSPDGPLHRLPFAALPVPASASARRPVRVPYVGESKPVHLIASLSLYREMRSRPRSATTGAAGNALTAFGDPDPIGEGAGVSTLPRLPGTRAELQALGRLFGSGARLRMGKEATPAMVLASSGTARYLHFACHGLLDPADSLLSGLALSPDPAVMGDTGLLQVREIMRRLRLRADLVVLSACDTGLGETSRYEGVVGLTRAFQYAGARSVAVSLWQVSDESTAALMPAFYAELRRGSPKDVALQRAMAIVRRQPRWSHPYFWAPFVLVGDRA